MAFTTPTITHTFQGPPGTPSTGTVEFSLLGWMTNGTVSLIPPMIQTYSLDASGNLTVSNLPSNLDTDTQPAPPWNSIYRVDIDIVGAQAQSFVVTIPPIQTETNATLTSGSTTVTLSSLTAQWWMIGQSVTGTGIPTGTIVTGAVNVEGSFPQQTQVNQITISNPATVSATGATLTLGATVDLAYLLPTIAQPL